MRLFTVVMSTFPIMLSPVPIRIAPEVSVNSASGTMPRTHIVIYQEDGQAQAQSQTQDVQAILTELKNRVAALEAQLQNQKPRTPFFHATLAPEPTGIEVVRKTETVPVVTSPPNTKTLFETLISGPPPPMTLSALADEQEEEVKEEEEVEEEEEVQEEEVDDDAIALIPFEYEHTTYYRDDEHNVYQIDEDEDIDDTPIGLWSESLGKPLFKIEYKEKTYYKDTESNQVYEVNEDNELAENAYGIWSEEKNKVLRYSKA